MFIARTGFTFSWGPGTLGDFRYIFLLNIGETKKKILPSERGAPGIVPYAKSLAGYCIMFIKRLDEGLRL